MGVSMKCMAAVVHAPGQDWSIEEIEVDPPRAGEVLVRWTHAGLCHSDEHVYTGDFDPPPEAKAMMGIDSIYPMIGGHEGAGIVTEVGPGVPRPVPARLDVGQRQTCQ
jgi:Zn-dependent alcohol dehydrogenase